MNMLIWNSELAQLKLTPAHDLNDYDMGQRHKLEIVNHNPDATTNENVPEWLQGSTVSMLEKKW